MYVGGRAPLGSIANWLYRDSGDPLGALNSLNGMLVLDRTGIPETELFNYVLEIEADPAGVRLFGAEPDEPGVARAPNVFDALARLGLTLERTKDSREYIIIERIDRPTPN
jgi:uncharacterized protein (TIGR03435 family)